jgi:hypothetical protein
MEHPQSDGRLGKRCLGELRIRLFVRALPLPGVTMERAGSTRRVFTGPIAMPAR